MRIKLVLLMMGILVVLTGCNDPIQDDLLTYINDEMIPLSDLEDEILQDFDAVTGEKYTDDFTLYNQLNDVLIPKYQTFIVRIESVKPETKEVKELHELFIDSHNHQYNAMLKILIGIDEQDENVILEANQMLDESRKGLRNFMSEVDELADKHGVKPSN